MFRDNNYIYLNSKAYGGLHDITLNRMKKGTDNFKALKKEIISTKKIIDLIEKKLINNTLSNEDILKISDLLIKKNNDLIFLQNELNKFSNLPSHKTLKTYKKIPKNKLKKQILKIIEESKNNKINFITKEDVAFKLNVKQKFVEQIFMELNREGILHQPVHNALHDSNRDPYGFSEVKGWASDIYYIMKP